jgi:hypothetical protein
MPGVKTQEVDRPICINHGCSKGVSYTTRDIEGNKRWTVMCGHCIRASQGRGKWAAGVSPWKTGYCSNQDSHLGFDCTVNYKRHPHFIGMTEVDHKNGDHTDNRKRNLDELCPMCHRLKSKLSGDLGQLRTGQRKHGKRKHTVGLSGGLELLMV